jgi:hypothetical protein
VGEEGRLRRIAFGWPGLTVAFLGVHLLLGLLAQADPQQQALGDITGVYRFWMDYWRDRGVLVGVDTTWVYPIGALVPMMAAYLLGDGPYVGLWLTLVTVLDAGALVLLARRRFSLAWWWVGFTACLGPVALFRVDAVALPIAIAGVLLVVRRPGLASALLTAAAWVKVWPAALVAAMLAVGRRRALVLAGGAAVSAVVVGIALALGARANVFSFIGAQTGRGLQIEAPIATPWLLLAAGGAAGAVVYYDRAILTWQVRGDGTAVTADWMNLVLIAGVAAVLVLGILARRRGGDEAGVLALVSLGLVTALVALNKVGSPQYFTWFVAPVLLGLLVDARRFRVPGVLLPVMAVCTQVLYPWNYTDLIRLAPPMLALLALRNLLELVLLGWVLVQLLMPGALRPAAARTLPHGRHAGNDERHAAPLGVRRAVRSATRRVSR